MNKPMRIGLRPAVKNDFDYCKRLYFEGMSRIIDELSLDRVVQAVSFQGQWVLTEVRIITLDGSDVGWLQSTVQPDGIFIAQLFVDGPFQGRGIGTEVMNRLIDDHFGRAMLLEVVKINPALRLYERLGFRMTGEDGHKFCMRRDPEETPAETDRPSR
jgi:ribosomal protein S18 acetylase RimI-like enzyme